MNKHENIRALIVEDDMLVGEMIQGLMEELGYVVVGRAINGAEAVEMTCSLRPDLVLMDIEIPYFNGIEATRRIIECCPTPVVMVTAHETPKLVEQASEAGVGAYLVKPPNGRELERAITIAVARFDDMMRLRSLNAELQSRNEDLDTFAHTVAHDLQSPLSLMIGYAQIMAEGFASLPPEALEVYLNTIVQNGRKLSDMVDALLLLASVRRMDVAKTRLDMAGIVAEALQRVKPLIEECQPTIILPGIWPEASGYEPWIEEVWTNYISNALKYGGHPPRLELGAETQSDGMVRFWIEDNGPGLAPEEQARLFIPFTRLDQAQIKGYGLGLSIVRRIVEKLGGKVGVESTGVSGQGSIFHFTLPGTSQPPGQ